MIIIQDHCKNNNIMKKLVIFLIIAIVIVGGVVAFFRLTGDEDTWICTDDGGWQKHGNPSSPMPQSGCSELYPTREGYITNYDSATQKETQAWYFLYEEPGAPAISKIITLAPGCKYVTNKDTKTCLDAGGEFYNGQRVQIYGPLVNNTINAFIISELSQSQTDIQMANPASVYCEEQGGESKIVTSADGSQSGVCVLNNKECEEWGFFKTKKCE